CAPGSSSTSPSRWASTSWLTWSPRWPAPRSLAVSTPRRRGAERGSEMAETEPLEFVQIAAAKEHLYGMTRSGAVWRYDDIRRLWERSEERRVGKECG